MRTCPQCGFSSPTHSQYCINCGVILGLEKKVNRTAATHTLGQPPAVIRKRKYRAFIPGLGLGVFYRDPQTGQFRCAAGCLITAVLTTVLAALLAVGGILLSPHPASPANLTVRGSIVPGQSVQVHGSNFPPSSTVGITVDGTPLTSRSIGTLASTGDILVQEMPIHLSDNTVTVGSDGTFDIMLPVPSDWEPGSHHIIGATTQNAPTPTQVSIDVETQPSEQTAVVTTTTTPTTEPTVPPIPTPTPSPTRIPTRTPTPTPTPSPTPTPPCISVDQQSIALDSYGPTSKTVVFTNCGQDRGTVSIAWKDGGRGWLSAEPASTTLDPGRTFEVTIGGDDYDCSTCQSGEEYTGTVTATLTTSGGSSSKVVNVTFVDEPPIF